MRGERLGLNKNVIDHVMDEVLSARDKWKFLIATSFLSDEMKARYRAIVDERIATLTR